MKSAKLLTILFIGIIGWMHSCIEKKKTTDEEVTAEKCKEKKMKFNETDKKCVAPDVAFCQGLGLGFKESPPECIAKSGTGSETDSGSNIDTSIRIAWDPVSNPLAAGGVIDTVGRISLTTAEKDPYDVRIWVAKNSNCTIGTPYPADAQSKIIIDAKAQLGTKECKFKVLSVNRKTNKYFISEEFTIGFK